MKFTMKFGPKCDRTSTEQRKHGIKCFFARVWYDEIPWFMSISLGFACANRSTYFFNLKEYEKCVVDAVVEVVAVDKAFAKKSYTIYGWKCNIFLKSNQIWCRVKDAQ